MENYLKAIFKFHGASVCFKCLDIIEKLYSIAMEKNNSCKDSTLDSILKIIDNHKKRV